MSSIHNNYGLNSDNNKQIIVFNNNCLINRVMQTHREFGQQLTEGLSLDAFINGVIANVAISSDKCDVWSDVLLDIIDNNVVNDSLLLHVLNIAENKAKSPSIPSRIFSCKMLAKLSVRLNEFIYITKILPLVQCLCHDFQPSVRAHISKQFFNLSQNLSLPTIKSHILPQLKDMITDEEVIVRIASFETLTDFTSKLDLNSNEELVLPEIVRFFGTALNGNDNSLHIIFKSFGKLCKTLPNEWIRNQKWFLDYYCDIFIITNDLQLNVTNDNSKERDIQCRNLLANYFPILFQIYGPNDRLFSILNFLCSDLHISVVQSIASVFNQIHSLLKNGFRLYPQLSKLMSLKSIIVCKELMPFLANLFIDAIKSAPNEKKNLMFEDMTRNLIECENTIGLNLDWRLHIQLYESLTLIMPYLPVIIIKNNFRPLLLNRIITSRQIPLRIASSRCMISLFRDIPVLLEDMNIYEWFVANLSSGKSSQRMLFLNICELIIELCDTNIFVSYFLEPLLELRSDRVPNIRLNAYKKLKSLKKFLSIPEIREQMERIKGLFRQLLITEKDRDVRHEMKALIDEFEWKSDFDKLEVEELTQEFICLSIDGSIDTSTEVEEQPNNSDWFETNDTNSSKSDSPKVKSCLPQLINSQTNGNCSPNTKCLPISHINNTLHSIPSKIPKAITKSSKQL